MEENLIFKRYHFNTEGKLITVTDWGKLDGDGIFTCPSFVSGECSDKNIDVQYTGKKDINKKYIYEGDIIKHGESIRNIIRIDCRWIAKRIHSDEAILLCFSNKPEVIGNIYSNPELL